MSSNHEEPVNNDEWMAAADRFQIAVAQHQLTVCERDVDQQGPVYCCIIAGLVAAAPYMKSDPTLGIVTAYELGLRDGRAESGGAVKTP